MKATHCVYSKWAGVASLEGNRAAIVQGRYAEDFGPITQSQARACDCAGACTANQRRPISRGGGRLAAAHADGASGWSSLVHGVPCVPGGVHTQAGVCSGRRSSPPIPEADAHANS